MGLVAFIMGICIICVYLLYSAGNCILEDLYKSRGRRMEIHHSDLQWLCTVPTDLGCAVFLGGTGTGGRRRYFKFLRRNRGSYRFACASGNSTHECGGTL